MSIWTDNQRIRSPEIEQAERAVFSTYGDVVSAFEKGKNLTKFGINDAVGTSFETVAEFQGSTANETFTSTNSIDSIVSSSASDTQTIGYEGHTIDGSGNLTFVADEVTLTGQTPVSLPTTLARLNRMFIAPSGTFNSPQALPVGTIYGYDATAATGVTGGVPDVAAATKSLLRPGEAQTEKAQTAISKDDYYFISSIEAAVGVSGGSASRVEVQVETRDVFNGGVWRPIGREIVLNVDQNAAQIQLRPFGIVPKNHDIRVRARTNSNTAQVFAEIDGYLAKILV